MSKLRRMRRFAHTKLVLLCLIVTVAVVPTLSAAPAQGDEIDDLRTRAANITRQMADLQTEIRTSTTAVEKARYRSSRLKEQIADKKKALAAARRDEASTRRQVSKFALRAYISGGQSGGLGPVLGTDGDKLGQRSGYESLAVGDRQQLVDEFAAAKRVTKEQTRRLQGDQRKAAATQAHAEEKQSQAEQAAGQLATIKRQLSGKLAKLVAERQAAQARAAERRIRAQAEAKRAKAEARAQAEAQQTPTAPQRVAPAPTPTAPATTVPPTPEPSRPTTSSPTTNPPTSAAPPNASAAQIAVAAARSQLGVPYSWGGGNASGPTYGIAQGANTRGFDCSGLTLYAYAQAGITLSHLTWDQMKQGRVVPLSQIQAGDLVFYSSGGHMGIYAGGGQVIHAPQTGDVVKSSSLYMMPPELVVRPTG